MIYTIVAIIIAVWLALFLFHIAGSLVHLLLVLALIVFIMDLFRSRRTIL